MKACATIVAALAACCTAQRILRIVSPTASADTLNSAIAPWMGLQSASKVFNVSKTIPSDACSSPTAQWCTPDAPGILIREVACSWERRVGHALDAGCSIVMGRVEYDIVGGVIGGPYQFDGSDVSRYSSMIVSSVSRGDFALLERLVRQQPVSNPVTLAFNYTPSDQDSNPWVSLWRSPGFRFFTWFFIPAMTVFGAVFNAHRLIGHVRNHRREKGMRKFQHRTTPSLVPMVAAAIEMVGWLPRLVLCTDYAWSTHLLPRQANMVLFSLSFPLALAASLVVSLAWMDQTGGKLISKPRVVRYSGRIAAVIAFGAVLEGAFVALRLTYSLIGGFSAEAFSAFIYFVSELIVGGVFTLYGVRFVRRIRAQLDHLQRARAESKSSSAGATGPEAPSEPRGCCACLRRRSRPRAGSDETAPENASTGGSIISGRSSSNSETSRPQTIDKMSKRQLKNRRHMTHMMVLGSASMFITALIGFGFASPLILYPYGLVSLMVLVYFFVNLQSIGRLLVFDVRDYDAAAGTARQSVETRSTAV